MIKLVDGLGQLGTALGKLLEKEENQISDSDVTIYHVWDFLDKSEEVQKKHYEDFIELWNSQQFIEQAPIVIDERESIIETIERYMVCPSRKQTEVL